MRPVSAAPVRYRIIEGAAGTPPAAVDALRRRLLRLAFDVHDGPMQRLAAVGYALRNLQGQRWNRAGDDYGAQLGTLAEELAEAERELRELITTLESGGQAGLNSVEELAAAEVARFAQISPARVRLAAPSALLPDSRSQEIALRSVLHEALTNVAKHADATEVTVLFVADDEKIQMHIADDGRGFAPANVKPGRIGLTSMRERLELLGGSLDIATGPGGPTVITAHLPRFTPLSNS